MNAYKLSAIALVVLLAVTFFAGYYVSDYTELKSAPKKLVYFDKQIGPTGVIEPNEIIRQNGYMLIKEEGIVPIYLDANHSSSMLPFIDVKATVLATEDFDFDKIKQGDIIIYKKDSSLIGHTVMSIESDEEGTYLRCRGYNNVFYDTMKVRADDVKYLVTGVLYGNGQ